MRRLLALGVLAALVSACGNDQSPVAPTPVNVVGAWTGTFSFNAATIGAERVTHQVTASFTQSAGTVAGRIELLPGAALLVSGTIDGAVLNAGITGSYPPTPSNCPGGTASVAGTVSSSRISFAIPTLRNTGICTSFTNGDVLLTR